MADLANLRISVDSREVKSASNDLEGLATSARLAEGGTNNLAGSARTTSAAMSGMSNAVRQAQAAQDSARAATSAHRAGVQQLNYQIGDMATMFAMGSSASQIFASQLGQTIQAVQLMTGGTSRLAAFLGGPWGVIISTAAVVLAPFIGKLFESSDAADAAANSYKGAADEARNLIGAMNALNLNKARMDLNKLVEERTALEVLVRTRPAAAVPGTFAFQEGGGLYGAQKRIQALKQLELPLQNSIKIAERENAVIEQKAKVTEKATGASTRHASAVRDNAKAISEEEQALKQATDTANSYLASLIKQTEQIGKTAIEIKRMEVSAAAAAAPTKALADQITAAGAAWEEATGAQANADFQKNVIKPLQDELELVFLTGDARKVRALDLQKEAKMAEWAAQGVTDLTARWEEYYQLQRGLIQGESLLERQRQEAERLKDQLNGIVALIDDILGGAGSNFRNILVTLNANFDTTELRRAFDDIIKSINQAFNNIGSNLGKVLGKAFAGAEIGTAVDSIFKGIGIKSSTGGAQIGGAIGGAAFGPIGAIAGSIFGGIVGGLFQKTKTGAATISQIAGGAMEKSLSGNNAQLRGVADKLAGGLLSGLGNIAEQLGGTLGGAVKLSIGMRKKSYVVDPTGAGRTKGAGVINFGEDQAAAVAYATQLAIQQGILTGISAGAQTLLKAGGDLQAQLSKALKFDQVFKDLRKETDPLGATLAELTTEMEKLRVIFDEAGASAADYAALEQLYAIKQAKAIFEASKPRRELEIQLMEAQGNAAGALAAQRALELESMDASLRGLQQQVWAAQDAAKAAEELAAAQAEAAEATRLAAETAAALAADRRDLEIQLMEAQGNASGALAARRALELAAMDASLRALQTQIWTAQDAARAADELADAQARAAEAQAAAAERARQLAADRRRLEIDLMEAQGNTAGALAARRALELESMDESLRALQRQIWAAQETTAANERAAAAAREYSEALKGATDSVVEEIQRLRGVSAVANPASLKAQFAIATAQARMGNIDAMKRLPELSQAIERATLDTASSALEVARIRAWLANSLSQTVARSATATASPSTAANVIAGPGMTYDANQINATSGSAQTTEAVNAMRNDVQNALYQIARNTGRSSDIMNRWDGDGIPDFREYASNTY